MNIISYKPAKEVTVEQAPVIKRIGKAPIAPRLVFNPDGTVSPIEDHLNWDFDKPSRLGE